MTHRCSNLIIALSWALAGVVAQRCSAQDLAFELGREKPGVTDVRSLGLESGARPAVDNAALLNRSFANSSQLHWIYFPSGRWDFTATPVATRTARAVFGNGLHRPSRAMRWRETLGTASRLYWAGGVTTFDGSTSTASTRGASDTIWLSSGAPPAQEKQALWTLEIAESDDPDYKFIPGTYMIMSVDTLNNRWTLDRVCSTGTATGMVGTLKGTLWRDAGFGNTYRGLYFQGRTSFSGDPDEIDRAAIGWHQLHNTGPLNTGKATLENCAFADFDVALLFGAGLDRFGEKATSFASEAVNHADHPSLRKIWVQGCDYAYVVRTQQSVGHNIKDFRSLRCNTCFYLERGGQFSAEDITVSGFVEGEGPTLLRLGKQSGNNCQVRISDFNFDSADATMKVLEMDGTGNTFGNVTFESGSIDKTIDYKVPIFTVKDGWKLVINGFRYLKPGSIKIERGGAGYIPHVVVMNSILSVTNQEDVISRDSSPGANVDFFGNSNYNNSTVYANERYVVPRRR